MRTYTQAREELREESVDYIIYAGLQAALKTAMKEKARGPNGIKSVLLTYGGLIFILRILHFMNIHLIHFSWLLANFKSFFF